MLRYLIVKRVAQFPQAAIAVLNRSKEGKEGKKIDRGAGCWLNRGVGTDPRRF